MNREVFTPQQYEAEIHHLRRKIAWMADVAARARAVIRGLPRPASLDEWPEGYHHLDGELEIAESIGKTDGEPAEGGALPIRGESMPPVPPIHRRDG